MKKRGTEPVLLRGFYLRLIRRWYLVPAAVIAGALVGILLYFCIHVVFAPAREYAAGARLYLEFAPDAAGNARDLYNAWTWKELVTSDDILGSAMNELIDEGLAEEAQRESSVVRTDGSAARSEDDELLLVPGPGETLTRAKVLSSVTVRLPSDLRVMMLTVRHRDPAVADHILQAMTNALVRYGEMNENFREIRVLESTPALLLVEKDRTLRACLFGAVCGLLLSIFCLYLFFALDDALYDPEMCARRFDPPVLGLLPGTRQKACRTDLLTQAGKEFERELRAACAKQLSGIRTLGVLAVTSKEGDSTRICSALTSVLGERFMEGSCQIRAISSAAVLKGELYTDHTDGPEAGGTEKATDGSPSVPERVVLGIPAGKRCSALADHLIGVLAAQQIPVAGILLYDTDLSYLVRLYGMR